MIHTLNNGLGKRFVCDEDGIHLQNKDGVPSISITWERLYCFLMTLDDGITIHPALQKHLENEAKRERLRAELAALDA